MKYTSIYTLLLLLAGSCGLHAQNIVAGAWHGKIDFPGQSLRLTIHLGYGPDGWTGSLDSPDQNITGIIADEVSVEEDTLIFFIERLGASYEGFASQDGGKVRINGTFSQAGFKLPLALGQDEIAGPNRPQTPVPPFPYTAEDVTFFSPTPEVNLVGTLTTPDGEGPFPAVVLISGSGPQDRDETIAGHRPFHVIADALSRHGIAVLRYDERGLGDSEGEFSTATSADFADDAEAAMDYLAGLSNIDRSKIGIIGHSEGGLIAPMIASRKAETGFIVMLAGPSIPGQEVLDGQSALILSKVGMSSSTIQNMTNLRQEIYQLLRSTEDDSVFVDLLTQKAEELVADFSSTDKLMLGLYEENLITQFAQLGTPWFRYFIEYDPMPSLKATTCPILALNGDLDVQILPDPNLTNLEQLFETQGHPASKAVLLEGLNHLFQPADTGLPVEYPTIETTFDPETLDLIVEWINSLD